MGVGDVDYTPALDLTRSCYLLNGRMTQIDSLEQVEGTVVRSEDYGKKWFVNGKLVASESSRQEDGVVKSGSYKIWDKHKGWESMRPIISLKGQVKVTEIEFYN